MSALSDHLERLLQFLRSIGLQPPPSDLRILEVDQGESESDISPEQLKRPSEYEKRFDELLQAGYPWLNMSCWGVWNHTFLIVAIVVPSKTVALWTSSGWGSEPRVLYPGRFTSVNISGPQRNVLDNGWNVDCRNLMG